MYGVTRREMGWRIWERSVEVDDALRDAVCGMIG